MPSAPAPAPRPRQRRPQRDAGRESGRASPPPPPAPRRRPRLREGRAPGALTSVRAAAARAFLGASPGGGGAVPRAERGRSSRAAVRRAASSATARGSPGGRAGLPRAPPPAPAPAPASRAGRATPGRAACGRRRRHCRSLGAPQRGGPGRRAARSDRPGVVFSARRGARGRGGGRARRGGGGGAALTRMRRPRPCGEPPSGPRRFPPGTGEVSASRRPHPSLPDPREGADRGARLRVRRARRAVRGGGSAPEPAPDKEAAAARKTGLAPLHVESIAGWEEMKCPHRAEEALGPAAASSGLLLTRVGPSAAARRTWSRRTVGGAGAGPAEPCARRPGCWRSRTRWAARVEVTSGTGTAGRRSQASGD